MSYAGLTVVQLKEKLKERGLSTSGVKSDLVARLTEADAAPAEEAAAEPEAAEPTPAPAAETAATEPVEAAAAPAAPEQPVETGEPAPAAADEDPVDLKAKAVELLEVKAKRAEKFGNQGEADALRRTIKRIDKFGLLPENPIYREIVGASKALHKPLDKHVRRKK